MVKYIRDPIYGIIEIDENYINSPYFQRLRYIIQNGMAYLVFPSMRHSRFEHSLGTRYIASKLLNKILNNITQDDKSKILELAMYHDIGHFPFSHTFEFATEILKYLNKNKYDQLIRLTGFIKGLAKLHEMMGIRVLKEMNKNDIADLMSKVYNIEPSNNSEVVKIAKLIINSELDADRLDYLQRDSYYSGAKFGIIDPERIINEMRICANGYIFPPKAIDDLEHFFLARFHMYSSVYNHVVIEIFNRIMAYFIAYAISNDDINIPTNVQEFIDFTDDKIISILRVKKNDYEPLYNAIINRRRYLRSTLEGKTAEQLIQLLDQEKVAKDFFNDIIFPYEGKIIIGKTEIETKRSDIYIERTIGSYQNNTEFEREDIVKLPDRYRIHIAVYDESLKKEVSRYFSKNFNIGLTFKS
ncbi:HD domain-containing protein [Acidianus brierleyi]|uniref:Interferon-gamma inducible protein n=1 Tax=Acidianus brierleyi TaxID=41673 RepID=A0A2U9IHA8_9CREN|nr:HD domain-containing protein [Acidianus brierleyi]AWR95391.1 HD domain-containing protein [Acidianus brierleyi]